MSKRIFVSLLALILLLSCGVTAHCAWKWEIPEKWKRAMPGKKSASRILIEVAGKRKKLKIGTNPVYIQGPEGDFRIVSYAWGAYSILGYSAPEISEAFCLSGVSGERGYKDILLSGGVNLGNDLRQRGIACVYFLSSGTGKLLNFTPLRLKSTFDPRDKYMRNIYLEALSVLGDINEDGFPDLVATDRSDGRPKGCSVLLALSGKDGKEIWRVNGSSIKGGREVHVVDAKTFKKGDTYTDARFGSGLAVYPDINGDGIQEILAGAPQIHNREIKGWGCLLVFSGKDGSLLKHIWLPEAKGYMGYYIDIFPDIDGDNLPEIMLGVPSSDISASEGGAVLVVSSKIIR